MTVPIGLVIVDHGSRRAESNAMHEEFVASFAARDDAAQYIAVAPAHMELATPTVADAIDAVVTAGARRVLVMPYFLFAGNHWERDIPALVDDAARAHPGVEFLVTAPVGLQDVVRERLDQCARHAAGELADCDLCARTDRCRWVGG